MRRYPLLLGIVALGLSACATAPKPLQGEFASTRPSDPDRSGEKVRWGGEIIRVDTQANRSCFEVLGRDLDDSARPRRRDESAGRFIACHEGFYDPEVFTKGREITVTGTYTGSEIRKVGDYDYRYAQVDADVIYLWRKPVDHLHVRDPWLWFGWDPYWRSPFAPPVVIIRSRAGPHAPDR